ncbi:hypothetical protein EIP91_005168 [Steccherinum ochraceum]|uniref:Chromo domain-containing protein n=1 Tax=Steccherinum ochraceum TaxID=92696 RepID=A0A4V2MVS5_9APHY|nr:hypothetical protein EIP91_005168 [Steccherinum ochraceum]
MVKVEEEYVVERVLRARVQQVGKGKKAKKIWEYFVKWAGYPDSQSSWEPPKSFEGSEDLLEAFWDRISTHQRDGIDDYSTHTEIFPTGPPRKPRSKKPSPTASTSKDSEVVQDSEPEVPLSMSTKEIPSRKRRVQVVVEPVEELPAKRARRKSTRAAEASPEPEATKETRGRKSILPVASMKPSSASGSSKRPSSSRRKSAPEPPESLSLSLPRSKRPAKNRFAPVEDMASVVSETTPSIGAASDIANVLALADSHNAEEASREEGIQKSQNVERRRISTKIDTTVEQPLASGSHTTPTSSKGKGKARDRSYSFSHNGHLVEPSTPASTVLFTISPTEQSRGTRPKASIIGLFKTKDSLSSPINRGQRSTSNATSGALVGPSTSNHSMSGPRSNGEVPGKAHDVDPSRTDAHTEYGDEDAEGEIDDELLHSMDVEVPPPVDVEMQPLDDHHMPPPEEVEMPPAEKGESEVVASENAKQPADKPVFSDNLKNTIFGPLSWGGIPSSNGASGSADDQRHPCPVKLNYNVILLLTLEEVHAPKDDTRKKLDEIVAGGDSQVPGKFYKGEHALSLANAFSAGGSCARGALEDSATQEDKDHFRRFKARLLEGDLFITTIGTHTLALCASSSNVLGTKLGLPEDLLSLEESVLITEVAISDDVAYCDAVINADTSQW